VSEQERPCIECGALTANTVLDTRQGRADMLAVCTSCRSHTNYVSSVCQSHDHDECKGITVRCVCSCHGSKDSPQE